MSVEATHTSEDGSLTCSLTFSPLDVSQVTEWVGADEAGALGLFIGTTRNSFQGKKVKRLEYEAYSKLAMRTMIEVLEEARTMTDSLSHPTPSHLPLSISPSSSQCSKNVAVNGVGKVHLNGSSHHHDRPNNHLPTRPSPSPSPSFANPSSATILASPPPSSLIKLALHHRLGSVPVGHPSIIIAVSSPHRKEAFVACEWILEETKKRVQVWKREVYETPRRRVGLNGGGEGHGKGGEGNGESRGGDGEEEEEEESEWKANAIHMNAGLRS